MVYSDTYLELMGLIQISNITSHEEPSSSHGTPVDL